MLDCYNVILLPVMGIGVQTVKPTLENAEPMLENLLNDGGNVT